MNLNFEPWNEQFLDLEDYQVARALTNAALDAIRRARHFGTNFVVEEDGNTKLLRAEDTAPYEKRLLEDLERLNRKIAELQMQSSSALSLNDTPNQ